MNYDKYKNLLVEKKGRIVVVTMNRPEYMNAVNLATHKELRDIFIDLHDDPDVWVAILTGAGRAFCAGGDITWFKAHHDDPVANPNSPPEEVIDILTNILNCPKPIIAAVNGAAIGLGASLALFCDIVIVSEKAHIADKHVNIGLTAGDGCAAILPMLMGVAKAKEYMFTGDAIDLKQAEQMGAINKIVPADQVMTEAMAFAERLASGAPQAIQYTKLAVNKAIIDRLNLVIPGAIFSEYLTFQTQDHLEAVNAFLEKRTPKFSGR